MCVHARGCLVSRFALAPCVPPNWQLLQFGLGLGLWSLFRFHYVPPLSTDTGCWAGCPFIVFVVILHDCKSVVSMYYCLCRRLSGNLYVCKCCSCSCCCALLPKKKGFVLLSLSSALSFFYSLLGWLYSYFYFYVVVVFFLLQLFWLCSGYNKGIAFNRHDRCKNKKEKRKMCEMVLGI